MKRLALCSVIALALAALAGCGGSAKDDGAAAPATVTVTEPVDAAPSVQATTQAEPDSTGATDRSVGQSGKDGSISFKVVSIGVEKSIPLSYQDPITAPAGAKLMVVRVTYRNDGRVKVDPFCGSSGAVLIDDRDRNFEFDSSNAIFIEPNSICEGVQPGFKATDILPFIVPAKAQITAVALWDDSEDGDYSGESSWLRFRR